MLLVMTCVTVFLTNILEMKLEGTCASISLCGHVSVELPVDDSWHVVGSVCCACSGGVLPGIRTALCGSSHVKRTQPACYNPP